MSDRSRQIRNPKLVLITRRTITQLRLAEIVELEARIAFLQEELNQKYASVSVDLRNGAAIEEGPHKAWFTKLTVH
jgi:hypothetical protein